MDKNIINMLKKVMAFDVVIALIIAIASSFISKKIGSVIVLGLIVAATNFIFNAYISNYALIKQRGNKYLVILASAIRVIIVCLIAIIMYTHSKFYVVAFIGGYSTHFIALIFYGIVVKNEEGE